MANLRRSSIFGLIALLAMIGVGVMIGLTRPPYYVSPTTVRVPGTPWHKGPEFLGFPVDELPALNLAEPTVEISTRKIRIAIQAVGTGPAQIPTETVYVGPGETAVFADGSSIRPIAGSLGYAIGGDQQRYLLETTEFDPATGQVTEGLRQTRPDLAKLMPFWPTREIHFGTGALTNIGLAYELEGLPNAKPMENQLWDGKTGFFCDSNQSGFAIRDRILYDSFYLRLLHPFEAVATVNLWCGPFAEFLMEPTAGEVADTEHFRLAIVDVFSGQATYAGPDENREVQILGKNFQRDSAQTVLIASLTTVSLLQMAEFDVLTTEEVTHPAKLLHTDEFSGLAIFTIHHPIDSIAKFRIRYRPHAKKAVFALGELPGMPAVNHDLDNLFEVTVPWVAANSLGRWADLAQVSFRDPFATLGGPRKSYRDTTITQILQDFARDNPGARYVVDPHSCRIESLPPRWQWLRDRTPDWLPVFR